MDDDLNTITTGSKGWKQAHEYFREEHLGEDCRGARLQDSPLDSTQKKKYLCYREWTVVVILEKYRLLRTREMSFNLFYVLFNSFVFSQFFCKKICPSNDQTQFHYIFEAVMLMMLFKGCPKVFT